MLHETAGPGCEPKCEHAGTPDSFSNFKCSGTATCCPQLEFCCDNVSPADFKASNSFISSGL